MIKILNYNKKTFESQLDKLLSNRKDKVKLSSVSVINIVKDVKKNGDKALLKYEKKFNKNRIIVPSFKTTSKLIASLDIKVKNAILIRTDKLNKKQVLSKMSKYIENLN